MIGTTTSLPGTCSARHDPSTWSSCSPQWCSHVRFCSGSRVSRGRSAGPESAACMHVHVHASAWTQASTGGKASLPNQGSLPVGLCLQGHRSKEARAARQIYQSPKLNAYPSACVLVHQLACVQRIGESTVCCVVSNATSDRSVPMEAMLVARHKLLRDM